MTSQRSSFGTLFFMGIVAVGTIMGFNIAGIDPMPALRGIHLGYPLVFLLAGALVFVVWAGKFFDTR